MGELFNRLGGNNHKSTLVLMLSNGSEQIFKLQTSVDNGHFGFSTTPAEVTGQGIAVQTVSNLDSQSVINNGPQFCEEIISACGSADGVTLCDDRTFDGFKENETILSRYNERIVLQGTFAPDALATINYQANTSNERTVVACDALNGRDPSRVRARMQRPPRETKLDEEESKKKEKHEVMTMPL